VSNGENKGSGGLLTVFKEVVTAGLGILIIAAILFLMWPPLTKSPPDTASAQGIFAILGGWGGVILGYYFGRLPSEKAADKASQAADSARKDKEKAVTDKTNALADSANGLGNTESSLTTTREKLNQLRPAIKEPRAAETLENVIKEIHARIAEISAQKEKLEEMRRPSE
jgi:hypothetical protein